MQFKIIQGHRCRYQLKDLYVFLLQQGQHDPKYQVEGVALHQPSL